MRPASGRTVFGLGVLGLPLGSCWDAPVLISAAGVTGHALTTGVAGADGQGDLTCPPMAPLTWVTQLDLRRASVPRYSVADCFAHLTSSATRIPRQRGHRPVR